MNSLKKMDESRVYRIKDKLNQLILADTKQTVFGTQAYLNHTDIGHHYKLLPPATQDEIDLFESTHKVSLPYEYKAYLTHIANGGAGRYYGLYSLAIGAEQARKYSTETTKKIEDSLSIDFPITNEDFQNFIEYLDTCKEDGDDDEIVYPALPEDLTGVIFLSDYGCGWSYILVVKGEQIGTVWMHGYELRPCFSNDKQWGFFDWYESWLDQCLSARSSGTVKTDPNPDIGKTIVKYDRYYLKEIPEVVFSHTNLRKLIFSGNELTEFPKRITAFNELRTLDLSRTNIIDIPEEIAELTKLKKLRLNYNLHTDLPASLARLENLQELEMNENDKLQKIPEVVCKIKSLSTLKFWYCLELKCIPENIGDLTQLESLDLSGCSGISSLPESIGKLTNLKNLFLDGTSISRLPENISLLDKLEVLKIGIDSLDYEDTIRQIKKLKNLREIAISSQLEYPTALQELMGVRKLSVIKNLHLHNKGNEKFPLAENITLIPNLEELNLSGNKQLDALPGNIGNISKLLILDVTDTPIKSFPESIKKLKHLKRITSNLNQYNGPFGISPEEKEELIELFPNVGLQIW
jgi:Leucine-rich repeat (LRR) protein